MSTGLGPEIERVRRLADPELYRAPVEGCRGDKEALLGPPVTADGLALSDEQTYQYYVDHSCDLTMRGGTTSGVVYPLAVCALAQHYVFRSVGGASAGALAASATAAAELGRLVPAEPDRSGVKDSVTVRPGFAGLAEIVLWLTGPAEADTEHWRLAQLFRPSPAGRAVFRLLTASMQSAANTKRNRARCLAVAAIAAVGTLSRAVVAILLAIWLLGPLLAVAVLPPSRWTSFPRWTQWTVIVLAVALLALVGMAGRRAAAIGRQARPTVQKPKRSTMALTRLGAALVAAAPLLLLVLVTVASSPLRPGQLTDTWPGLAQWATWAAAVLWWLVLTLAVLMAFVLMYGLAMTRLLEIEGKRLHFGLVPGAVTIDSTGKGFGQRITRWFDRLAGMPSDTGVPPLSVWLADRIDDLAGVPPASGSEPRHALTFGDLWLGRAPVTDDDSERERLLREAAEDPRKRAVNLELMATNVSQGRPYKLPFAESKRNAAVGGSQFLFCQECLTSSLPDRVVRQMMSAPSVVEQEIYCPTHAQRRLRLVPEPWDLPVILAARMSMALPGLITAVPLFTAEESTDPKSTVGTRQWFSDGGITSNFPIHFFDSLLPRWPTFGLNLQAYPPTSLGEGVEPPEDVWIPPQDATSIVEPSRAIGSATAFAGAILDTSLGWRDTMQSALPGFRGRIAHVRQRSDEGGTNLFMKRKTILCLALRGLQAGDELKKRFTCKEGGQPEQTQTDQYRWIRMRLAMRKYRELAGEVAARSWLYTGLARRFEVPVELGGWFGNDAGPWPGPDPEASVAEATVTALAQLTAANQPLYAQVRGAPPLNPNLRLTPPE